MKPGNVIVVAALMVSCSDVAAQERSTSPDARFEVASVKPAENRSMRLRANPGQFTGQMALIEFVSRAYRVPSFRIVGPDWFRRDWFSIAATIPADAEDDWRSMLRNLLAERFALKVHWKTQDMPVYRLVTARSDGTLGPNLRQARGCSQVPSPNGPECGFRVEGGLAGLPGVVGQTDWNSLNLAQILSTFVGRHVVDRTGLSGEFSIEVQWAHVLPPLTTGAASLPEGPSLFDALKEQLGLKLEAATEPVEVLVIDAVSQPTPD